MADGTMSRALTPMGEKRMATPAEIDPHLKARLKSLPNLSVTFRKISVTDNEREFLRAREAPEITAESIDSVKGIYREVLELALPAPVDMIVRELTAMSLGMARRKDQEADYRGLLMVTRATSASIPKMLSAHAPSILDVSKNSFLQFPRCAMPVKSDLIQACASE